MCKLTNPEEAALQQGPYAEKKITNPQEAALQQGPHVEKRYNSDRCSKTVFSPDDFKKMCEKVDACYALYNGDIINLTSFKHPGDTFLDRAFLKEFNGRDVTEFFDMAHSRDKKALKVVRALAIGKMSDPECLLAPEDKELRSLRRRYTSEGRFDMNWDSRKIYVMLEPFFLIALGWYLRNISCIGMLISFMGFVRLFWWLHDVGHHAIFEDGKTADLVCDWIGYLAFACFLKPTTRGHSIHHTFTNTLDLDSAILGASPFKLHPSHASRSPKWFVRVQVFVWYGIALPFYMVFVVFMEIMKMSAFDRMLLVVRICPVIMLHDWTIAKYTLVLPWFSAGVVAFLSSLNHFHMDMEYSTEKPNLSFVNSMAACTQDYTSGPIWDYFTGGLARHTAHHLFPTLPNWKLAGVAGDVEKLLAKHKVQYNQTTFFAAVQSSAKHLYEEGREWIQ